VGAGRLGAVIVVTARVASAQTSGHADLAAAELLFQEGKRLLRQGDFGQACPKLVESFRLDSTTGTLLALARCHEEQGKWASAWAEYTKVVSRSTREGRSDRAREAQKRASALEPRLSTLTIRLSQEMHDLAGLEIKRDGAVVGAGALGVALPVDGGDHVVEASAAGKKSWQARISVASSEDKQVIEVPQLEPSPGALEAVPEPSAAVPPVPPPSKETVPPSTEVPSWMATPISSAADSPSKGETPSRSSGWRTAGVLLAGAGVVGFGVATAFVLRAVGKNDDAENAGCSNNVCPPAGKALRLEALTAADTATVAFVAGGVLTATGVAMFVLGSPVGATPAGRPTARLRGAPWVGPTSWGLVMQGRF
jgi:hypothetical protein